MRLITAHKVTISGAFALAIIMTLRAGVLYTRAHRTDDLVVAMGSAALALGFAVYLRSIWAR